MREIRFSVAGLPPAKNEAKLMLAAGHLYADRVVNLLRAAHEAVGDAKQPLFPAKPLGLELTLYGPTPPPSDATNYLVGVGDVLEAKVRRGGGRGDRQSAPGSASSASPPGQFCPKRETRLDFSQRPACRASTRVLLMPPHPERDSLASDETSRPWADSEWPSVGPVTEAPFTIETDGDETEKAWWPQWTRDHFPSYEAFWVSYIVPLTYRVKERTNIRFQTSEELAEAGYTDEDVAVAQLHYTLLRHLGRVFELLNDSRAFTHRSEMATREEFGRDEFFESFARLSGASDVSDELLARRANPGTYGAWNEAQGREARGRWRQVYPDALRPIRAYRNRLVHGRIVPELNVEGTNPDGPVVALYYPRLEKVDDYLDWRVAFDANRTGVHPDFDDAVLIVLDAWERLVRHVEKAWQEHLLDHRDEGDPNSRSAQLGQ
jgi:hypothetical protein